MYQIDNEKFGTFLCEMRKEKNMTQKELAEKLFVSDKTVSKWERGASIPNVALLIPIADVLGITVTELLKGERLSNSQTLKTDEAEHLLVNSLDLSVRNSIQQNRKKWRLAYLTSLLIVLTETILLVLSGIPLTRDEMLLEGLFFLFAAWFCFFAKNLLPAYYDNNKINFVSQGIFKIQMPGLSFNNNNWSYICTTAKIYLLGMGILIPMVHYIIYSIGGAVLWNKLIENNSIAAAMYTIAFSMLAVLYAVGKKYE